MRNRRGRYRKEEAMKSIPRTALAAAIVLTCMFVLALCGCEGSDARKSITGTVEDLVGTKAIETGERMKKDMDRAMEEEARRLLKVDGSDPGESSRGQHEE